jgi:hypothetical protein
MGKGGQAGCRRTKDRRRRYGEKPIRAKVFALIG